MDTKRKGPQYLSAHGGFTHERPQWMPPKGLHTPQLDDIFPELAPQQRTVSPKNSIRLPNPKPFKTPKITEAAAQKIAQALHILLSESDSKNRR